MELMMEEKEITGQEQNVTDRKMRGGDGRKWGEK